MVELDNVYLSMRRPLSSGQGRRSDAEVMSLHETPGEPRVHRSPAEQLRYFANLYQAEIDPVSYARVVARTRELGLAFSDDELVIIAALDTPDKVQEFLNTRIYYNHDHGAESGTVEETARPPRGVLQTAAAHCFEGALLAYTVDYLHGYSPHLILLEASQDSEHNLILYQDSKTGLYGVNAHSGYANLEGRPAQYPSPRAVAESYIPFYYSDYTHDPRDLTLVGYSDPIDLVARYGTAWMASERPLWDIYSTYIDEAVEFHYLFDGPGEPHLYPLIRAIKEHWIRVDAHGQPFVSVSDLPSQARDLWHAFWRIFHREDIRPRGTAREIEAQFTRLTGTTPLDLEVNTRELASFLKRGYRIEQLLTERESDAS